MPREPKIRELTYEELTEGLLNATIEVKDYDGGALRVAEVGFLYKGIEYILKVEHAPEQITIFGYLSDHEATLWQKTSSVTLRRIPMPEGVDLEEFKRRVSFTYEEGERVLLRLQQEYIAHTKAKKTYESYDAF
jgi:hypothetical protein